MEVYIMRTVRTCTQNMQDTLRNTCPTLHMFREVLEYFTNSV